SSGVDPRADQYALGSTLYFLIAGQPPFPEADVSRKLYRKQHTDPVPVHTVRPDVPPGLSAVVQRMLARPPGVPFAIPVARAAAPPTARLPRPPEPPAPEPPPVTPSRWWAAIFRLVSILLRRLKPGRGTDVKTPTDPSER